MRAGRYWTSRSDLPVDDRLQILGGDGNAILKAQQVLEQHLHREGQTADIAELFRGGSEAEIIILRAVHVERGASAEGILANGGHMQRVLPYGA
jgi:hypothetical protein